MKIINPDAKHITIVCCQHGNEIFGLRVFKYFKKHAAYYSNVKVLLANERAIRLGKRFVTHDLNRSYAVSGTSYEKKLARRITVETNNTRFLLDIHTTTAAITFIPIIARLTAPIRQILRACQSDIVVHMSKQISAHSLIGQRTGGVSLEYNERYAQSAAAFSNVIGIVHALLNTSTNTRVRTKKILYVTATIPHTVNATSLKNFQYHRSLKIYPVLAGEKNYTSHCGFAATTYKKMRL